MSDKKEKAGLAFLSSLVTHHLSRPLKPYFHVAEGDDIAVVDLARLAVGDAAAVDEGAVGRARVGDEQRALAVHHKRRVNLRDARVLQLEVVVGHAPDAHP